VTFPAYGKPALGKARTLIDKNKGIY